MSGVTRGLPIQPVTRLDVVCITDRMVVDIGLELLIVVRSYYVTQVQPTFRLICIETRDVRLRHVPNLTVHLRARDFLDPREST